MKKKIQIRPGLLVIKGGAGKKREGDKTQQNPTFKGIPKFKG